MLALALVGKGVGQNWESWRHNLGYVDYAVAAAAIVGIAWWLLKRRGGDSDAAPA